MTLATLESFGGVVGAVVAVLTLWFYVREQAKRRIADDIRERAEIAGQRFADGVRSRDDEVRQLTFERDDARREAENLRMEKRELLQDIRNLRDGRR